MQPPSSGALGDSNRLLLLIGPTLNARQLYEGCHERSKGVTTLPGIKLWFLSIIMR